MKHAIKTGLAVREGQYGETNGMSSLTENDVLDMRNAYMIGCFTHKELANAYDISRRHAGNIIQGKRWGHL